MEIYAQQVVNAISLGGIYALLALGLAIVFSIMGLVNFAHGDLMTVGGYTLWFGIVVLGAPLPVMLPVGVAAAVVAAIVMERVAFRPVRGATATTMLLTSFAVSIVLQVLFQIFISPRPLGIPLPEEFTRTISLFGIRLGVLHLSAIVVVAASLFLITLFLRRTTLGISMRAAAQDFEVARLMGIRANRVVASAFGISGFLAGLAALLWIAQRGSVDPTMGLIPVIKAFIAAVLGGLGSLPGAVLGGFILGAAEVLARGLLPEGLLPFADVFSLTAILMILMWRPQGLLGKVTDRA